MPSLTDQEIQQTYNLLEKMYVPVEETQLQGMAYVKERLTLCRAMQDQCHDLRLKTLRAYSWVQEQLIYTDSLLRVSVSDQQQTQLKQKVSELKQQKVSHATLSRLVGLQYAILVQTQRDIKALLDIIKSQIKLGEEGGIDPHEAEQLIQQVSVADIGQEAPAPDENDVEPEEADAEPVLPFSAVANAPVEDETSEGPVLTGVVETGLDGLFAPMPSRVMQPVQPAAMETVSFDGFDVITVEEAAPRGIPVADLSGVPIESLFDLDEESRNGDGTHHPAPAYRAF
jgi:hypothetical protein